MRPGLPNNFILNGFDRSGSSAISRVLATHPDIEIIMQPFNGDSIREKLYQIIDDSNASANDVDFFSKLEYGVLEQSYIKSQWHEKHSSVPDFVPGKLHLIKTTQNHLSISWVRRNFPLIENWGVWRKPIHILASLVRNNFHIQWYADAAGELIKTVESNAQLNGVFGKYSDMLTNPVREMAYIIATRSWFFFYHLEQGKVIDYQEFARDPNTALNPVLQYFGLTAFDFGSAGNEDLNITGKEYRPGTNHLDCISPADHAFCEILFQPLYQLPATSNLS